MIIRKINLFKTKLNIIIFPILIFVVFFLQYINIPGRNISEFNNIIIQQNTRDGCINQNPSFKKSLELQCEGLPILNRPDGSINLRGSWELIPRHFNEIWLREFENMEIIRLKSDEEEQKYFVKFSSKLKRPFQCNFITLGVGHTISVERNISTIYPECHFYAADPSSDINADLVHNELGGAFFETAVGGETLEKTFINVWDRDMGRRRIVPQISIIDFLRKNYQKNESVDIMSIDVEGSEFGILEQLVEQYHNFSMPICQFNMEIHKPNEINDTYTYERFFHYFDRFIRSGNFALLHTDIHKDFLFLRVFFVNILDEICAQKFLC